MRKLYLITLLIIQMGFAQVPVIDWHLCMGGTSGDYANCTRQTTDGGYIMAGYTSSNNIDVSGNHGGEDVWIVKLTSTGTIAWQKTVGGTGTDRAYSIQQTSDDGYIIAGYTNSNDGDISGNHGDYDFWVIKISTDGTLEWQKTFGGTSTDRAYVVQQTGDGGYCIVGDTYSTDGDVTTSHGNYDYWVVKITSDGILEWQKTYGGTAQEYPSTLQQTVDGGYIITGITDSNNGDISGYHGNGDAWVIKIDTLGALVWQNSLGGTNVDWGNDIKQTSDGGYIVAAYTSSSNGDVTLNHGSADYWVVKLSSSGIIEWQKTMGGSGLDRAYSIQQTSEGGYIVIGYTDSVNGDITVNNGYYDVWMVKLSNTGVLQWQKTLGGSSSEYGQSVQQTSDGGYIIGGYGGYNNGDFSCNYGGGDAWVLKFGPDALSTTSFAATPVQLFPNPTTSVLTIQSGTNWAFNKIIISDLTGKTVLESTLSTNHINVESLASGMYILQGYSRQEPFICKFVKK